MTKKRTILVAEDDAFFRRILTYQLTKSGYNVLAARDGREAIDWLHQDQTRPDLVLSDLLMPHYSGIDVLAAIKTLPYKVPVILMSQAERLIAQEGVNIASPTAFLAKPFTMDELVASVQKVLLDFYMDGQDLTVK